MRDPARESHAAMNPNTYISCYFLSLAPETDRSVGKNRCHSGPASTGRASRSRPASSRASKAGFDSGLDYRLAPTRNQIIACTPLPKHQRRTDQFVRRSASPDEPMVLSFVDLIHEDGIALSI